MQVRQGIEIKSPVAAGDGEFARRAAAAIARGGLADGVTGEGEFARLRRRASSSAADGGPDDVVTVLREGGAAMKREGGQNEKKEFHIVSVSG